MEDTRVHALDYLNVFLRRKWWLITPILASVVVGALLVVFLPKEYRSSATLGVMAPIAAPNLIRTSPLDNQERLRALSQQLVSAPILSRVVKEEGIGDGTLTEELAGRLRRSIVPSVPPPVATTNEPRRLDTFIVSYGDPDPAMAQRITNRLVNVFVDENSKARTTQAENTSDFLQTQLMQSQIRLDELEAQLRQEKEAHMGQLPEQTQANLQTLTGMRQQLAANATTLRGEQDRLSMIERQIESMQRGSNEALILPRTGESLQSQTAEARVATLQRELAAAKTVWMDRHPEVQRLEEELKAARLEAAADRQRPVSERNAQLMQDPAYKQLVADREMTNIRIRELTRAESSARSQIGMYQARVEAAPRVEQQLAATTREYELEKAQYSDLSGKFHAASIAENIEQNRRGEQFTVLYAANYPTERTKPIPWRVMLFSLVIGCVLGGAITFAREYLDRSVHDVRDLKDEFELPVLGEVSRIQPA